MTVYERTQPTEFGGIDGAPRISPKALQPFHDVGPNAEMDRADRLRMARDFCLGR